MVNTDLELRVRRLEQLHIWGASIVAVGFIAYFLLKSYKNK